MNICRLVNTPIGERAYKLFEKQATLEAVGVFSEGVYCECNGELVVFHNPVWGVVPFGVGFRPDCQLGDKISFVKNGLTVNDSFFCSDSENEDGFVLKKPFDRNFAMPTAERILAVEKYVAEKGSKIGVLDLYERNVRSFASNVKELFSRLLSNGEDAAKYALQFIGLGRGLTPSGDDFLCGMISLFFAAKRSGIAIPTAVNDIAKAVAENLSLTTKISGAYLSSVVNDEYFTIYDNAACSLMLNEPFEEYTDFVLNLGASSGSDTMFGAIFAARVLLLYAKNNHYKK